jgi:hypothetical protein
VPLGHATGWDEVSRQALPTGHGVQLRCIPVEYVPLRHGEGSWEATAQEWPLGHGEQRTVPLRGA